jgi:hypothetical protein
MAEHREIPHSLDKHINEPCSGKGRNEPSRIRDLEVERGKEKDAADEAAKEA